MCFPAATCLTAADAWTLAPFGLDAGTYDDASADTTADDAPQEDDAPADVTASNPVEDAAPDPAAIRCPKLERIPTCGIGDVQSGPTLSGGMCCYTYTACACTGRPFVVEGRARVAGPKRRDDWNIASHSVADDEQLRKALAKEWLEDALLEHASIASFARLVLELVSLGAPPDLLREAMRAASDEIEHAKICFGLSSIDERNPVGPGPLAMGGALVRADFVSLAIGTVREGCVGETLGALVAFERARCAELPTLRTALERIARDEARHAALAWRIVRWAIERGGDPVRGAVLEAFRAELALVHARLEAPWSDIDPALWHAHGRLTPKEELSLLHRGARDIVEPCAAALLCDQLDECFAPKNDAALAPLFPRTQLDG